MNKTQILIALVILSIFGISATYLDLSEMVMEEVKEPETERKVRDGEIRQYTKDQRLKTIVNYDNGIKHGTSYLYHTDGETVLLAMPYDQGKREGTSMKYYENGQLYASTSYHNDLLHGARKIYYSSGQLKAVIDYENGNPGIGTEEYLMDGKLKNANKIIAKRKGDVYSFTTAEACKDTKFYIGKLINDRYFDALDPNVKSLSRDGATYYVDLNVYTPSYLKYQDIICHCESTQGNPVIMKTRLY